jgi:nicotinate-nucleotide adenylyltransferase
VLRLVLTTHGNRLKVREPLSDEELSFRKWEDKLLIATTSDKKFMMAWTSLLPDLASPDAKSFLSFVAARFPVSPRFEEFKALFPELIYQDDAIEWIFFGGSFNPWHDGHQACLNLLPPEKTCFVLPDHNPHKELREIDPVISTLGLSVRARFGHNHYHVPTFLMDPNKNPTVDWISRLQQQYPEKELSLLIGFDSFAHLTQWTRAEELLGRLSALYVASRLESDESWEQAKNKLLAINPRLRIYRLGRHAHEALSSTDLRNKA